MEFGADGLTDLDYDYAFRDPVKAKQEIDKIIKELQEYGTTEKAAAEKAAKAAETVRKEAERRADDRADEWLKKQIQKGLDEKAAAEAIAAAKRLKILKQAWAIEDAERRRKLEEILAERQSVSPSSVLAGLPLPVKPPVPGDDLDPVPDAVLNLPEFYKVLNIRIDATFEEVKKGYRREALKWHPDKNRDNPEEAAERFKKISEAFDTLFDPEKRSSYDSGQALIPRKVKKLAGHGWNTLKDDDDQALTSQGFKWKRSSWIGYVLYSGRIDDTDPIVDDPVNDPRVPQEKIKVFWRFIGEKAYDARKKGGGKSDGKWLRDFLAEVWKDTPCKWPGAAELQSMNETAQAEWKERRMVYNRRKEKVLLNIQLHEAYLAIPGRERKERARISEKKIHVGQLPRPDGDGDPFQAMVLQSM